MLRCTRSLTAATAGAALTAFLATPSLALEAEEFGNALKSLAEKQSMTVEYDSIEVDGSDIVMSGLSFVPTAVAAAGENEPFRIESEVRFEGVEELDGGAYRVAKVGGEGIAGRFPEQEDSPVRGGYSIGAWAIEGMTLGGAEGSGDAAAALASIGLFYDRMFIQDVAVDFDGADVFTMASAEATSKAEGDTATFRATVDGLEVDLTTTPDPELKAWVEGTGYDTLRGSYESEGTWSIATGLLDAPKNTLRFEEMGEFNMDLAIGGYTPEFMEGLQEVSRQMNATTNDPQAQQAAGMQMLGLLSQLQFGRFNISYDDEGMTNRLFDYYAQENGQTKDQLVQQTIGILPLVLAQLRSPDLQAQVQEAVTSFMNDPQSFTISLEPDAPTPFPVLIGAAMASPADLVNALNAKVTANQ